MIPKQCSKVRLYIELYPWKGGTLNYFIKDWGKIIHMRKPGSAHAHVQVCFHTRAEKRGQKNKLRRCGSQVRGDKIEETESIWMYAVASLAPCYHSSLSCMRARVYLQNKISPLSFNLEISRTHNNVPLTLYILVNTHVTSSIKHNHSHGRHLSHNAYL